MRDLTEEEFKLAPEGFLEYGFNRSGGVFFFDRARGVAAIHGDNRELKLSKGHYAYSECKPITIPPKPFDITKHEVANHITVLEKGELGVFDCGWVIDKGRAIAIAKALCVNGEDLK